MLTYLLVSLGIEGESLAQLLHCDKRHNYPHVLVVYKITIILPREHANLRQLR